MWRWALLLLGAATTPSPPGPTVEGIAYGPQQTLTCTWFTNFENSRFEECRAGGESIFPKGEGASVHCVGTTCAQMDAEARRLIHWKKPDPPWGTFIVRVVGRASLSRHAPRYLGDGAYSVMAERLLGISKAGPSPR